MYRCARYEDVNSFLLSIKHRDPSNLGNSLSFAFDRIFDTESKQIDIYAEVGKGLVGISGLNGRSSI
jgi:hypothetical protein